MGIVFPGKAAEGVTLNGFDVQTVVLMRAMVAIGFTVTVNVNELLGQKVVDGKIVYVAVCTTSVPLVRIPEI